MRFDHSNFGPERLDLSSRDEDIRKHVGAISKIPLLVGCHFAGQGLDESDKRDFVKSTVVLEDCEDTQTWLILSLDITTLVEFPLGKQG